MFNNVTMMGRIVNDLELKVTPNGTSVCTFRIAVERGSDKRRRSFWEWVDKAYKGVYNIY